MNTLATSPEPSSVFSSVVRVSPHLLIYFLARGRAPLRPRVGSAAASGLGCLAGRWWLWWWWWWWCVLLFGGVVVVVVVVVCFVVLVQTLLHKVTHNIRCSVKGVAGGLCRCGIQIV